MDTMSKEKLYAVLKIALITLAGVVAFAAIPPYRLWALGTLPGLALAMYGLTHRQNRVLLAVSYALLAILSLGVGHFFWQGSTLSVDGMVMLLVALPIVAFTLVRIAAVELGEA